MKKFEDVKNICPRLLAQGFALLDIPGGTPTKDVWLRRAGAAGLGNHDGMLLLEFKPSYHAYSVSFGIADDRIRQGLRRCLSENEAVSSLRNWRFWNRLALPCWVYFNFGRALDWKFLMIPDPRARDTWEMELIRLVNLVDEYRNEIVDDNAYARMLMCSEKPFEYWSGDPVVRAGETTLALIYAGANFYSIMDCLAPITSEFENATGNIFDIGSFVKLIMRTAPSLN